MDVSGISGNAAANQQATLTPTKPEVASTPVASTSAASKPEATQPKHDTVELTGPALAKSLKLAGQTPSQIALKMGLDVKTVNGYLGTSTKAATSTPAPSTNSALQVEQAAPNTAATPQPYSLAEEATEPASQKATETAQGKK